MTEANKSSLETEGDVFDVSKVREHIKKIKIFRLLLGLPKDAAEVREHDPENDVDSTYQFSIVVSHICKELKFSEEVAISILRDFSRQNYVRLSLHDDEQDESEIEKSIQNKDGYDKIELSFSTARILEVLLDDSIVLSEGLEKLIDRSQRQEEFRASYETQFTEISTNYESMGKLYSDTVLAIENFEEAAKTTIKDLNARADSLKAELNETVKPIAEKKAKETAEEVAKTEIRKELKLDGDIGSAMQNIQKDIIQFMGIFVAIFALIGLSIGRSSSWSVSDFFCMSLVITASMATLLFFISVIINGKRSRTIFMGIASVILWTTAAFAHFVFPVI